MRQLDDQLAGIFSSIKHADGAGCLFNTVQDMFTTDQLTRLKPTRQMFHRFIEAVEIVVDQKTTHSGPGDQQLTVYAWPNGQPLPVMDACRAANRDPRAARDDKRRRR